MMADLQKYGPWALVLGASDGVGAELARRLAGAGLNLFLSARKHADLDALAIELAGKHGIQTRVLALDLAEHGAPDAIIAATKGLEIGLLAYVAGGGAKAGPMVDHPREQLLLPIALNPVGQTLLAAHFGKAMRQRGRGGIMIVSSNAAASGLGGLAVYAAAKAYTTALCEGLWYELKPHGVDVMALIIGVTRTPSIARQGVPIDDPNFPGAWPADVAEEALAHLADGPVWYASGTGPGFERLRALPRDQAAIEAGDALKAMMGV
jgi:short-subunit dehydrogenase